MPPVVLPTKTYKAEFYFQQGQYGWSELWWYHDNIEIDQAFDRANDLATLRIPLLGNSSSLMEWMVSLQGLYRDSLQSTVKPRGNSLYKAVPDENPFTALLLRQQTSSRYRRNLYLRGLPKGLVLPFDNVNGQTTTFLQGLAALQGYLLGAGQRWSIQSVTKEPAEQGQPVLSFIQGGGLFVGYTQITPPVAGATVGSSVRLRQVRFAAQENLPRSGVYKVVDQEPGGTVLATPWLGNNTYQGGALARVETELHYSGNITLVPLRLVRRKVGVIHLQTKGKKKPKS